MVDSYDPRPAEMADAGWRDTAAATTGAYLALLAEDSAAGLAALQDAAGGGNVLVAGDLADVSAAELSSADVVVFDRLGVAVLGAQDEQGPRLLEAARESPGIVGLEPERIVHVLADSQSTRDYLLGYRAAVDHLVDHLVAAQAADLGDGALAAAWDESRVTWGLQACRVPQSCATGRGVKVAVLDTGVNQAHPDLATRSLTTRSLVDGEEVEDGHGHGTHCIGTACGTRTPSLLPRYGVASDTQIFAGKVLSNAGSGTDRSILAGIQWAVTSGCRVVSLSLGAPVAVGTPYSRVFEQAARRAMDAGTLLVAAAGNDSRRPGLIRPVSHPANCPSVLAVAALTPDLQVAPFSNAGLNPDGGQVDVAAPGVNVYSSWPEPVRYRRLNGTSMATPHVAGVVALLAEQNPSASPADLKNLLLQGARRLPLPATDVGAGLAQAP